MKTKSLFHKTIYFLLLLTIVFISGCMNESLSVDNKSVCPTNDEKPSSVKVDDNRIKLNNMQRIGGYIFLIIEVDGEEYLTQYSGGFIKLEK